MLGPSPFRIGQPPKALLPFSTAEPFDKISGKWWGLPGDDWRADDYSPHRIEILGDGQQFVAYARHPRGTFYRWRRGEPMNTLLVDLPEIDLAKATEFLEFAERVLVERRRGTAAPAERAGCPDVATPERQRRLAEPIDDGWQSLDPERSGQADRRQARQAHQRRLDHQLPSAHQRRTPLAFDHPARWWRFDRPLLRRL